MTHEEIDFLLKLIGHRVETHNYSGYEYGLLMNIYFSIRDLRDMLTEPSEYYGASEFLYKDKNHDWNLNLENIINRLRTFQRSLYEIIEFVENFKRNNKND